MLDGWFLFGISPDVPAFNVWANFGLECRQLLFIISIYTPIQNL